MQSGKKTYTAKTLTDKSHRVVAVTAEANLDVTEAMGKTQFSDQFKDIV